MGVKYLNAINRTQKRALLFQSINNQLLNNLYKEGIKVDWQVWFVGNTTGLFSWYDDHSWYYPPVKVI